MEIYQNLPPEIQAKIKYYALCHPTAAIIREKISELRCDEFFTFRDKENIIFCKVDGRDFFADEYFSRIKKPIHFGLTAIWNTEAEEATQAMNTWTKSSSASSTRPRRLAPTTKDKAIAKIRIF